MRSAATKPSGWSSLGNLDNGRSWSHQGRHVDAVSRETSALFSPKMSAARQPTACKYSRTGSPKRRAPMASLSNFRDVIRSRILQRCSTSIPGAAWQFHIGSPSAIRAWPVLRAFLFTHCRFERDGACCSTFRGDIPGEADAHGQDSVRPIDGFSAVDDICADCRAVRRRSLRQVVALRRTFSGYGVCPTDLSGEPQRHRSLPVRTSLETLPHGVS
jgi:hypothetical protein